MLISDKEHGSSSHGQSLRPARAEPVSQTAEPARRRAPGVENGLAGTPFRITTVSD